MADHVPFAADSDGVYDADRRERWELEADIRQRAADAAMLQVAVEDERDGGGEANPARDRLCALWIGEAPRFGAVAAHFPAFRWAAGEGGDCERVRTPWSGFVASFWAVEMLFSWPTGGIGAGVAWAPGGWYAEGGTRPELDRLLSKVVAEARYETSFYLQRRSFWAPEVLLFGDLYLTGRLDMMFLAWPWTRAHADLLCSAQVQAAQGSLFTGVPGYFWSPELPEHGLTFHRFADATDTAYWFADGRSMCLVRTVVALLLLVLALPGVRW